MDLTTLAEGTLLAGTYRITGLLGSGGFANTYAARDLSLSRDVAIKEFFPADLAVRDRSQAVAVRNAAVRANFEWARERFVREARALAKYRHPNIVRVFNVFDANNTSYMVLEFVRGMDMGVWLRRSARRPSQGELDSMIEPLLDALEAVHATGMLHRDIKPENIYVRAENMEPVLLDFGAAKFDASERQARTTAAIVSSGYSPNEAYTTDKSLQGPWTDIYSLAATLHHAVTGKPPPEAVQRIIEDAYVPLAKDQALRRAYRSTFLAAIDAGLAVRPKSRPQTVDRWRRMLNATVPAGDARTGARMTRIMPAHATTQIVDRARSGGGQARMPRASGPAQMLRVAGDVRGVPGISVRSSARPRRGGVFALLAVAVIAAAGALVTVWPFGPSGDDPAPAGESVIGSAREPAGAREPSDAGPTATSKAAAEPSERAPASGSASPVPDERHGSGAPAPTAALETAGGGNGAEAALEPAVVAGLVSELGLVLRGERRDAGGSVSAHFPGSPGDRFKVALSATVARVAEVVAGSAAEARALKADDIVLDIAGVSIDGPEAAQRRIEEVARLGQREVVISVLSGNVYRQIIVPLGASPQ